MDGIKKQFVEAQEVLNIFVNDTKNFSLIADAGQLLVNSFKANGKTISCGNGGSMCDAMHFAEELTGRYRDDRKPLPAMAISDASYLSCTGNDYGYDAVFERYVDAFIQSNDCLLAISTSGNSKNVVLAAKKAKEKGAKVIALTGKSGGELAEIADVEIRAPHSEFADRAQEIHIKVIHCLIDFVERNM
jgi:D-sedoheptulose 7-phosphate isomerase